jgi:hypothetical protein
MEPADLRFLLIVDWAELENTPVTERRQLTIERWFDRARRLAAIEGRVEQDVIDELQSLARIRAARARVELITELSKELAIAQALDKRVTPPWRRRLARLAAVMKVPTDSLQREIEAAADAVRITVAS